MAFFKIPTNLAIVEPISSLACFFDLCSCPPFLFKNAAAAAAAARARSAAAVRRMADGAGASGADDRNDTTEYAHGRRIAEESQRRNRRGIAEVRVVEVNFSTEARWK